MKLAITVAFIFKLCAFVTSRTYIPIAASPEMSDNDVTNPCSLPPETGICRAGIPRYYYNSTLGVCGTFLYGGCQGNGNNFRREEDCMKTCDGSTNNDDNDDVMTRNTDSMSDEDNMRPDDDIVIPDEDLRMQYYNQMMTEDDVTDPCLLPPNPGHLCRADMRMYYYNSTQGVCEEFYYTGCYGNGNRFHSREDCMEKCGRTTN